MTKNPHIKYSKVSAYVPPEHMDTVKAHAEGKGLTVSSWLLTLIEQDMGIEFGIKKQIPHGLSKRRKKQD